MSFSCHLVISTGAQSINMMAMDHPKIFVGWNCRDERAFHVCLYAIQRRASDLVEIVPLKQKTLSPPARVNGDDAPQDDHRAGRPQPWNRAVARFNIPALSGFKGWALFVSSDMLVQADIYDLWRLRDDRYAVMSVEHGRKEPGDGSNSEAAWSSLVFWNCAHPANRVLDAARTQQADPDWLSRFGWLDDSLIGRLPEEWNWHEGRSNPSLTPKIIEFAAKEPWHREPGRCAVADRWHEEAQRVFGDLYPGPANITGSPAQP